MTPRKAPVLAAVALLMLAPSLAFAEGCSYGKKEQAMSCAEGTAFDSATNTCLPVST